MAYILSRSNGTTITSVADGTLESNATSLSFPGISYGPYAPPIANDLVKLMEHFAANTAPAHPSIGQVWYDLGGASNEPGLRVYTGALVNGWRVIAPTGSATAPSSIVDGDLWYDNVYQQLKMKRGSDFDIVGPMSQGVTIAGSIVKNDVRAELVKDTPNLDRRILSVYLNNVRHFTFFGGDGYPLNGGGTGFDSVTIPGFTTVYTGMTANSLIYGTNVSSFAGTVANALSINGLDSTKLLRNDMDQSLAGNLTLNHANGNLIIGSANQLNFRRDSTSGYGILQNNTAGAGWKISAKDSGGTMRDMITMNAATGVVSFIGGITATSIIADSAARLATPRLISLSGGSGAFTVTGSVNFDGSGPVSIPVTLGYRPLNVTGDTMTGTLELTKGLTVYSTAGPQIISATTSSMTLTGAVTVNGSLTAVQASPVVSAGPVVLDASAYSSYQVRVSANTTITFNNFTANGQTLRIVLYFDPGYSVTSWPVNVYWPNGITPVLESGPNKTAVVTLLKTAGIGGSGIFASSLLATYVTY